MGRTCIFLTLIFIFVSIVNCAEQRETENTSTDDITNKVDKEKILGIQEALREIFANEKPFISKLELQEKVNEALSDVIDDNTLTDLESQLGGTQIEFGGQQELLSFASQLYKRDGQTSSSTGGLDNHQRADALLGGRYGYLNEWVVHMEGGHEVALAVVKELGYKFHGAVMGFEDLYRVSHLDHPRLHKRAAVELSDALNSHDQVVWATQQESRLREKRGPYENINSENILTRVKRSDKSTNENRRKRHSSNRSRYKTNRIHSAMNLKIESERTLVENSETYRRQHTKKLISDLADWPKKYRGRSYNELSYVFNDELVDGQWYLRDTRTRSNLPRLDLGVLGAWTSGVTGEGVRVTILDDGIDYTHDDLKDNYDPEISSDYNDDDSDPFPRFGPTLLNSHGTKCAGEVAMAADNNKCGVGVAFNAKIGGVRMLDGDVSDRVEAESLSHARGLVDIVSCSWGPSDDGKTVEGPGPLALEAFSKGVKLGRAGKGTVYVWASGNGGITNDNCNCDGYASSIYTSSITSASQSNTFPWYGEQCSSSIASAYSSGAYSDQKIISADLNNTCTDTFSGTSAAAPLAAGIVALALEANPNLTWRDVQHLMVITSNYDSLSDNDGWRQNALGYFFNLRFGFGLLDATRMVSTARTWKTVPDVIMCEVKAKNLQDGNISSGSSVRIEFDAETECGDLWQLGQASLEHVQLVFSADHSRRGALQLDLASPRGTETSLLTTRESDDKSTGFNEWPFMSVHTWGEDPVGTWTANLYDTSEGGEGGAVTGAYLRLYASDPVPEYAGHLYKQQYDFHPTERRSRN